MKRPYTDSIRAPRKGNSRLKGGVSAPSLLWNLGPVSYTSLGLCFLIHNEYNSLKSTTESLRMI